MERRYVIAAKMVKELETSEKLKRTVKSLLNKFTSDKVEKLTEQFLNLDINLCDDMVDAIDLIFEKALSEPMSVGMYTTLCTRCMNKFPEFPDEHNPGGEPHTFKRLLLNKCQGEFQKGISVQDEVDRDVAEAEAAGEKRSPEEAAVICKKAKARMLGSICFLGELFKQRMLTENIMHEYLIKLLGDIENSSREDYIECLCKLMTTIGKDIDHAPAKLRMDEYFARIIELSKKPELGNRLRFLLQEVILLRQGGWRKKETSAGALYCNTGKPVTGLRRTTQEGQRRPFTSGARGTGRRGVPAPASSLQHVTQPQRMQELQAMREEGGKAVQLKLQQALKAAAAEATARAHAEAEAAQLKWRMGELEAAIVAERELRLHGQERIERRLGELEAALVAERELRLRSLAW